MRPKNGRKDLNTIEDEVQIEDLEVVDDELDGIKGGREDDGGGHGMGGDWILNHNETTVEDAGTQAETLDDLAVKDDAQIKAGPTNHLVSFRADSPGQL